MNKNIDYFFYCFATVMIAAIFGNNLDNNRLLVDIKHNQQSKIYQIETVQDDITTIYLHSAINQTELDTYLERFTADETVTDIVEVNGSGLHMVTMQYEPKLFYVVTEKLMKDGKLYRSTFVISGMFEDDAIEQLPYGHTVVSVEPMDMKAFMLHQTVIE